MKACTEKTGPCDRCAPPELVRPMFRAAVRLLSPVDLCRLIAQAEASPPALIVVAMLGGGTALSLSPCHVPQFVGEARARYRELTTGRDS